MGIIKQLDYETAMLVAAGEVIERPASVVKEILENSIDSGASKITLEIQKGGVGLIRCTDNGCGMAKEDLPLSIMRNATSKIRTAEDIARILTLGFRGEALASIAAVSDLRIRSKRPQDELGAELEIHPGDEYPTVTEFPMTDGTTIICENLFINVPARRKFLKKDSTEAAHITDLFERIALSNPSIAMTLIIDGKAKYQTPGDGNLQHAIYSIHGSLFAAKLISLDYGENLQLFGGRNVSIKIKGFVGTPENSHGTRQNQIFYINGRYVKNKCLMSALEQAYVSYMEASRFPACVMFVEMPPEFVDVNIHPTKSEVKFVADKPVFEAVFYSVRGALERYIPRPTLELDGMNSREATYELYKHLNAFVPIEDKQEKLSKPVYNNQRNVKQGQLSFADTESGISASYSVPAAKTIITDTPVGAQKETAVNINTFVQDNISKEFNTSKEEIPVNFEKNVPAVQEEKERFDTPKPIVPPLVTDAGSEPVKKATPPFYKIIGEAFLSYLFVEVGDRVMIIDKHAAHERILFEQLKSNMINSRKESGVPTQLLIIPLEIHLSPALIGVLEEFSDDIKALGFSFEQKDEHTVSVSSIPVELELPQAQSVFETVVDRLSLGMGSAEITRDTVFEKALYQASCKAAMKIGREYDMEHLKWLCDRLLTLDDIKVCPHGRPVAIELTKGSIEHQFKRI